MQITNSKILLASRTGTECVTMNYVTRRRSNMRNEIQLYGGLKTCQRPSSEYRRTDSGI